MVAHKMYVIREITHTTDGIVDYHITKVEQQCGRIVYEKTLHVEKSLAEARLWSDMRGIKILDVMKTIHIGTSKDYR